ncbi:hypothetical protein [Natrinema sp. 1APR25-10V2]|uniref:hypothetical protein n=1 Tax=Natrinema sp. 1APR25-10V2 TaxID=2951081 RepID=UPI002875AD9A|nr:hypothetical protein [Natrinema sp. 1APR25-10V2]MDS0473654.1 hypothetical protein [Natrinema sp. 1APR25-10V2]
MISASVVADENSEDNHNSEDSHTKFLGEDQNHIYLQFERNGRKKLNKVNKKTDEVVVVDRTSGEQEFVIRPEIVTTPQTGGIRLASHTPWSGDVSYTDEDLDGVEFGSYEIVKRAGRRWESLGHCSRDCNVHYYDAESFELGREASAVAKTVVAAELWFVIRKKGPQWLVNLLTKRRVEEIVTTLATLAASDTITFAMVDWDQSLPLVRDQKFISCRAGLTKYKPPLILLASKRTFNGQGINSVNQRGPKQIQEYG